MRKKQMEQGITALWMAAWVCVAPCFALAAEMPSVTDGNVVLSNADDAIGAQSVVTGTAANAGDSRYVVQSGHTLTGAGGSSLTASGIEDYWGTVEIVAGGEIQSAGNMTFNNFGKMSNSGKVTNSGTVTFSEKAAYDPAGGEFDNSSGNIVANATMQGLDALFSSLSLDYGNVRIQGDLLDITLGSYDASITDGTVTIERQNAASTGDIYLQNPLGNKAEGVDLHLMGGEFAGGYMTARNITIDGDTTLAGGVFANTLTVNTGTTTITGFLDYDNGVSIINKAFLVNSASTTSALVVCEGYTFENRGTFTNKAALRNEGEIINYGHAVFESGSSYVDGAAPLASPASFTNAGTVTADAGMRGLNQLAKNSTLLADSEFNIVSASNGTLFQDIAFANVEARARVNMGGNGKNIALGGKFDAGAGIVTIRTGGLLLGNLNEITASQFIVDADAFVKVAPDVRPSPNFSHIRASNIVFNGTLSIGAGNGLILGNGAGSSILFSDGSTLELSTITATNMGKIDANDANVVIGNNVTLNILGPDSLVFGQTVIENAGGVDGEFTNSLYKLDYTANGVYVASRKPMAEVVEDSLGGVEVSINKINGAELADRAMANLPPDAAANLGGFIQLAADSPKAAAAFGQLFGEYAAYSATPLMESSRHMKRLLGLHMDNRRNDRVRPAAHCVCGPDTRSGLWAEGTGAWSRQGSRDAIAGYAYDSGGVAVGFEYGTGPFDIGFAASYSRGKLKVDALSTSFDADLASVALYGTYSHESGAYAKAILGLDAGWNDYDVSLVPGGVRRGKFSNQAYSAALEMGYDWRLPEGFVLAPSVGVDFTHLRQNGWNESVSGTPPNAGVANWFGKVRRNEVETPLAVRITRTFAVGTALVTPELRAAWVYSPTNTRERIATGFVGGNDRTNIYGVRPGHSRWQFAAGVKARLNAKTEFAVAYAHESGNGYRNNAFSASFGLSF